MAKVISVSMSKDERTIFLRLDPSSNEELTHDAICDALLSQCGDDGWQAVLEAMVRQYRLKETTIATALAESKQFVSLESGTRVTTQRVFRLVSSNGSVRAEVSLEPIVEEPEFSRVKRYTRGL